MVFTTLKAGSLLLPLLDDEENADPSTASTSWRCSNVAGPCVLEAVPSEAPLVDDPKGPSCDAEVALDDEKGPSRNRDALVSPWR
mmetsp:Transcript_57110/g.65402  ORF Transcript_57110/g.65402 Transcript_57110/m.65402 type:complete len:85 (-) Transcript_57110:222-476(-)